VPSIVLGSAEVSPLEMASVYATFASDGIRRPPVFIRRVLGPDGRVLLQNSPAEERVLEPPVARSVTDVLRGVVERGTGRAAGFGRPAAGKTGTAQEWRDAWFDGYTPQLAAVVWMGSPTGQESMTNVGGIHVTGGSYPARIWSAFMGTALAAQPVKDFDPVDPAWWPPNNWIGAPPAVLPPGFVLPPHLQPLPPGLVVDPVSGLPVSPTTTTTTTVAPSPTSTTTTTAKPTTTTTAKRKH
jgi:penicillin-binding protein 1A